MTLIQQSFRSAVGIGIIVLMSASARLSYGEEIAPPDFYGAWQEDIDHNEKEKERLLKEQAEQDRRSSGKEYVEAAEALKKETMKNLKDGLKTYFSGGGIKNLLKAGKSAAKQLLAIAKFKNAEQQFLDAALDPKEAEKTADRLIEVEKNILLAKQYVELMKSSDASAWNQVLEKLVVAQQKMEAAKTVVETRHEAEKKEAEKKEQEKKSGGGTTEPRDRYHKDPPGGNTPAEKPEKKEPPQKPEKKDPPEKPHKDPPIRGGGGGGLP